MNRKIPVIALVLALLITISAGLCACSGSDGNYPVTVGHTVIKAAPEKVVCLSDSLADIIAYTGYSTQLCGISDECTQELLRQYIPTVGSKTSPDTDKIISSGATLVLCDTKLDEGSVKKLNDSSVTVMNIMEVSSSNQLSTVYKSMGAVFGGNKEGKEKGTAAFDRLSSTLKAAEEEVKSFSVVKTMCYLYLDENSRLCSFNSATGEGIVLDLVCATNVAANFSGATVDESILRLSNPDYIFYNNDAVLTALKSNKTLSKISALASGNTYQLPAEQLRRYGDSLITAQNFMLSKMYPNSVSEITTGKSLAADYGITLSESMSFKSGDDNNDIKPVQQRLIDLGFLVLDAGDSATTYFGAKTGQAVKDFQSANSLSATGIADYKTLTALFLSTAVSAAGSTAETAPASQPTTASADGQLSGYNIDLSTSKSYKRGDTNADVKSIQQRLADLRYITFGEGDSATEFFGEGTEHAIGLFQTANGITSTGTADYNTLKLLFSNDAKAA